MWFDRFPFSQQYSVGPLPVHPYGLAYLLGFFIAYAWLVRPRALARLRLTARDVQRLLCYCLLGVLIGGRLGFVVADVIDHPDRAAFYLAQPWTALGFWLPGRTSFGGIAAVMLVMAAFAARRGAWEYYKRLGDEIVMTLPLSFALVRLATFVIGSLPGRICEPVRPWCVRFRYPAALIEAGLDLASFFVLLAIYRRSEASGITGWSWIAVYGSARFVAEFWREPGTTVAMLSDAQLVALVMIVVGLSGLALQLRAARRSAVERFGNGSGE